MTTFKEFEEKNKEKLESLLDEYHPGHDNTQMTYFIVGQGITDYGKYKQALAETNSHYESLRTNYVAEKKLLFEIEEKQIALDALRKQSKRSLIELNRMFELVLEYEKKIEGKDRTELEKDYHIQRLQKLLAVNTVWRGGNLSGVMDTLTNLPDEMQKPLLEGFHQLLVAEQANALKAKDQALLEEKNGL